MQQRTLHLGYPLDSDCIRNIAWRNPPWHGRFVVLLWVAILWPVVFCFGGREMNFPSFFFTLETYLSDASMDSPQKSNCCTRDAKLGSFVILSLGPAMRTFQL